MALAGQVRADHGDERGELLSELDEVTGWSTARAADAPDNFLHLRRPATRSRAGLGGRDVRAAELGFDAARREAADGRRPWHEALITERTARFFLARGLDHAGFELLAQARQQYLAWGATAKVDQLGWAYPALRPAPDPTAGVSVGVEEPTEVPRGRAGVTTGTLDLLGIQLGVVEGDGELAGDELDGVEPLGGERAARCSRFSSSSTARSVPRLRMGTASSEQRRHRRSTGPGEPVVTGGVGDDERCHRSAACSAARISAAACSWPAP